MRLSNRKIDYLSAKLLKLMQENRRIHLTANPDLVQRTIFDTIQANMLEEENIEAEVDNLLSHHKVEIDAMDMDLSVLRQKMKRELARKRGFTL